MHNAPRNTKMCSNEGNRMLSDVGIKESIVNGLLKIEPFEKEMLKPACINLRLGNTICEQLPSGVVDPFDSSSMKCYDQKQINEKETYVLRPNSFILAQTFEKIGISKSLGVLLDGTSTLARLGISVTQTGMIVDTGHGWPEPRSITLEIKNGGINPIVLRYKMKVARMAVFKLDQEASMSYDQVGKYIDQNSVTPKPIRQSLG